MSLLEKLTFASTTKKAESSQKNLVLRRKMLIALEDQLAGAQAEIAGQPYMKQRERWMPVEGGGKERRVVSSNLRRFWFRDSQNRVLLEVRFGNKPLTIAGKPSIMVGELEKLPEVLSLLIEAVMAGELDSELAAASDQRRGGRKVKKDGRPLGNGTLTLNGNGSPGANAKALCAARNGK